MTKPATPEAFAPGEYLHDELEARGWSQKEFAEIIGRPHTTVNQIAQGKKSITPETARDFAAALGTSPEFWLNLQTAFDLARLPADGAVIARRAALHTAAPVNELRRRGWIKGARDVVRSEGEVLEFFGVRTLEEIPRSLCAAARRSAQAERLSPAQLAWCRRAKQLAEGVAVARGFTPERLRAQLGPLRAAAATPEAAGDVPALLAEAGVRFVAVKHLEGTKMDGAAMWLGSAKPVVALSLRFDRLDHFWFTLGHELGHLLNGDAQEFVDDDLSGRLTEEASSETGAPAAAERKADAFAAEWLLPKADVERLVAGAAGRFERPTIRGFAAAVGVHPAIVVGRLHWLRALPYARHRDLLVKIRSAVLAHAASDGWS